ncbi:MAG: dehydrogenase [Alphaproteobacteria bacterium]|nr:dehydrogenase [Alphaproteobacteria bacterium]
MTETFDYIIVGAGSAGCVLANRLSEDPGNKVALLEAGPMDRDPLIHIPLGIGVLHEERRHDWGYDSEPDAATNQRKIEAMRGKVVGGSSSINVMAFVRGNRGDYDRWAQKGATGWGYDDVLPYFRKMETWQGKANADFRGESGPLTVVCSPDEDPLIDAWIESARVAGYAYAEDYNAAEQEGFTRTQFSIRNGRRCSAAVAFLNPVLSRPNLELRTEVLAHRILFEGTKAVGIEYGLGNETRTLMANRQVILSAGVFNTPHLLMLSGIGPAAHLQQHGIDVRLDHPGVGTNLQDHLSTMISYDRKTPGSFRRFMRYDRLVLGMLQAHFFGSGMATVVPAPIFAHLKSRPELSVPDIQFIIRTVPGLVHPWFPGFRPAYRDGFAVRPVLLHPESRGRLELRSADPRDTVKVFQNFFSVDSDIATMREGVRMARRSTVQAPMDAYRGDEIDPGVSMHSDDELDAWIRETVMTAHHPCCTCAMGAGKMAVLDGEMKVRGTEGLRVVDGSVLPDMPSGNTNAPILMMAEKAADMILGRHPVS